MGLMFDPPAEPRPLPALPQPEEVFISWLLSLPAGADLTAAVDVEIHRLERYRGAHPGPARLGELFRDFRLALQPQASRERLQ